MKKLGLLVVVCAVSAVNSFALTPDQIIQKEVEKETIKQQQTVFNPHLTDEQMAKIPALLTDTKKYVHKYFDRTWVDETEVVRNLYYHFSGNDYFKTHQKNWPAELADYKSEENMQELDHALKYALVKTMGSAYPDDFRYNHQDWEPVKDWKKFHALCQGYMDEIYNMLLNDLSKGNRTVLEQVFENILI